MNRKGYTLQQMVLLVIIVVLLSLIAVPAYLRIEDRAKAAAVQGVLTEVRGAIKAYRANERLEGRADLPPPTAAVRDKEDQGGVCVGHHIFLDCDLPPNPFSSASGNRDFVATCSGCSGARPTTGDGWYCDTSDGIFWAATNVMGENLW